MKIENIVNAILGLVIIFLVSWNFGLSTQLKLVTSQVSDLASTTNSRLVPVEKTNAEIENIKIGGDIASSTGFIMAVYNSGIVIQDLIQQRTQQAPAVTSK